MDAFCARVGPGRWGLWRFDGVQLEQCGASIACGGRSHAALSDDQRLLAVLDQDGGQLRCLAPVGRALIGLEAPLPALPEGYVGCCLAVSAGVLYLGCRPHPAHPDPASCPERLLCLRLSADGSIGSSWHAAVIPEALWQPRKAIDHLFVRGSVLIAVDNIVMPKFLLTYGLADRLRPRLERVVTLRDFGAGGHILDAALGPRWLAVLSSHFYRDDVFYDVLGLTLLEADSLTERFHYALETAQGRLGAPPQIRAGTGGLRATEALAWDGDLLLLAGGDRGLGVVDLRGQALLGPDDRPEREVRDQPMVPGPEITYLPVPGASRVHDVQTLDDHAGCFVVEQIQGGPWRPSWVSRDQILASLS